VAFCPYCGTKNPEEAIACVMCGELLPTSGKKGKRRTSSTATPADEPQRARSTPKRANETQYLDMGDGQSNDAEPLEGRLLGNVKLVVEQGMILGEQFLLNDQELLIGRFDASSGHCPDIDLSAQDPSFVHRRHARLEFSSNGERLTLFDLGGRNGAYVNNRPVERNGAAPVRIGDKIRIGRVVMRLQPTEEAESYDRGR
jgi:hypothetical protein